MSRRRVGVAVVLSMAVLAGCQPPVETIETANFTFDLPSDWEARKAKPTELNPTTARGVDPEDTTGWQDQVNVLEKDAERQVTDTEEIGKSLEEVLGKVGDDVEQLDPIEIDGSKAAGVTAVLPSAKGDYRTVQYALVRKGRDYAVTFTFGTDRTEASRELVTNAVLKSWSWSD